MLNNTHDTYIVYGLILLFLLQLYEWHDTFTCVFLWSRILLDDRSFAGADLYVCYV